jgi:flagellar motor switch/type III secretory pathway protein FliN
MSKSRIEIHLVRVEGVKQPETLSCHVFLYNKLFDVMAPLTHNNKENKTILPLGSLAAFSIKTLEKHSKTLFTTVFNTRLLHQQSHCWLPLFTSPQELKVIPADLTGPRLFLTMKNFEEELTSCTPEVSITPEPTTKDSRAVFEELLQQKDQEIARLQEEIKSLKEQKIDHVFEINNKNIDPVEIFLNVYLTRNRLEGLIMKHKGNLYKHGPNFVEVTLRDNKLCCRTESTWMPLEDFLATRCAKEIEMLLENRNVPRSALASRNSSPKRHARRSENSEVEDPKHRRSESFKKLLKPTLSVLNKTVKNVQTKKSPFRC